MKVILDERMGGYKCIYVEEPDGAVRFSARLLEAGCMGGAVELARLLGGCPVIFRWPTDCEMIAESSDGYRWHTTRINGQQLKGAE